MLKSVNVFFWFVPQETGRSLIHPANNCGVIHGGIYLMAQMLIWLL
jgi:heme/copper-type cytochrome/quinol oxidase subunit 2